MISRLTGLRPWRFYPIYPMLIRALTFLGMDMRLAGYAISNAALLAGSLLLWKLAARETRSASVADRSVMFLLFCPGAVWFGMIYTESIFLVLLLGCVLCARQGRWIAAGLFGLASALTRTPGLLLAGFLALEAMQQAWDHRPLVPATDGPAPTPFWRQKVGGVPWWGRVMLAVAGPVAGNLAWLIFLQVRFGNWRAQQITMINGWKFGAPMHLPWTELAIQWHINARHLMAVSTPLIVIMLSLSLIGLFTLKRVAYPVFAFTLIALYVSATPGDAMTRYLSTLAPAYIVLAQLAERSRLLDAAALVFSVGLMVMTTVLLVNGAHVA